MFIEAMNSGGDDSSRMVKVGRYSIFISGGTKSNAEIDCTSIPNYQNLTADDFYFDSITTTTTISSTNQIVLNMSKSYNQNNGVLTVSYNETSVNGQQTIAFDVYAKIPSSGGSQGITESELVASITPGAQRTYTYTFPNNYDDYKNFLFTVVATGVTVSFTNMSEISSYVLGNSMTKLFAPDGNAIPTITLTGTDAYNDMRFVIYGLK